MKAAKPGWFSITSIVFLILAVGSSCTQQGAWDILNSLGNEAESGPVISEEEPTTETASSETPSTDTTSPEEPSTEEPAAPSSLWDYRMKITIPQVSTVEDLTDFPLLLQLDSSIIDYTKIEADGSDITFKSLDEAETYSYEIDGSWNAAGSTYIWVKIPTIIMNAATEFWMYYSSATETGSLNPSAVWSSGYQGVWHFNEAGTPWSNSVGSENAVPWSETPVSAAAWFGNGITVQADKPNQGLTAGPFSGSAVSLSFYLDQGTTIGGSRLFVLNDFSLYLNGTTLVIEAVTDGTNLSRRYNYSEWYGAGPSWLFVTWTGARVQSDIKLYRNGSPAINAGGNGGTGSLSTPLSGSLRIANANGGGQYTQGTWDEVHLSDTVRSADWIDAAWKAYDNTLLTYSAPEALP